VLQHLDSVQNLLPSLIYNFYVLIETTGSNEFSDKEKLEVFLLHAMEVGLVSDGAIAQDSSQASSFLHICEVCSPMIIMCITTSDIMQTLNNKLYWAET
nr:D-2-hydroxyglutarate dehydrogenase, mitochondrial [Tanacetum cinerariifolium]